MRKKIPIFHDFGDDCVPLIILSKRPRDSLIIYLSYYLVLCVFNIARLHVAETDVQYSEAGTQIFALALDLHNNFKQVHWLVPSTLHITQKHTYLENKKQKSIFKPSQSSYIVYIVIVFRRISKQHIFRFQNIYNVGDITHLTENIPYLPFWNWIALLLIGKPILKLAMTVVSWTANTKAQI